MGRLSGFKYREVAKRLKTFGFKFLREAKGSHEIWYSSDKDIYTTIPRHTRDMFEGTLRSILKQADIDVDEFLNVH